MPGLIGLLVLIGGVIFAISRIMDGANDVGYAARRFAWLRKSRRQVVDGISDAREAAAILMLQAPSYRGVLTDEDFEAVRAQLSETVGSSPEETTELLAVAGVALKEVGDAGNKLRPILRPINETCTAEQKQELLDSVAKLSALKGEPTDLQKNFQQQLSMALL
ncbi:MAG: hypothetical protein AAF337_03605 [Pseudomonadota bacterium]